MPVFLFSEVVSVGAVKKSFRVAPYSSNGQELDVVAPGNEIEERIEIVQYTIAHLTISIIRKQSTNTVSLTNGYRHGL